jgi:molybdopterin converting factor small subunit
MRIRVKGYNEAARYTAALPPDGALDLTEGGTIEDLMDTLAVPRSLFTELVILVNGRCASLTTALRENDGVVFFVALAGG